MVKRTPTNVMKPFVAIAPQPSKPGQAKDTCKDILEQVETATYKDTLKQVEAAIKDAQQKSQMVSDILSELGELASESQAQAAQDLQVMDEMIANLQEYQTDLIAYIS